MNKTRQNIIQKSIELFNEQGVVNVRTRDIAEALEISTGNLTYHYKTKQDLMHSVYRYMIKTLEEMSIGNQLMMPGRGALLVVRGYLDYIVKFRFFYQDTLEIIRAYPEVAKSHHQQVEQEKAIIKNLLYRAIGKGEIKAEAFPGLYDSLAHSIWMTLHFWLTQQAIRGEEQDKLEEGLLMIANLVYPYATEEGAAIFQKMQGELAHQI